VPSHVFGHELGHLIGHVLGDRWGHVLRHGRLLRK
jgi:hypothetical protein